MPSIIIQLQNGRIDNYNKTLLFKSTLSTTLDGSAIINPIIQHSIEHFIYVL